METEPYDVTGIRQYVSRTSSEVELMETAIVMSLASNLVPSHALLRKWN